MPLEQQQQPAYSLTKALSVQSLCQQAKVHKTFGAENITKKFYQAFREEHRKFMLFVRGIALDEHREWYTSVMLSRLMLVYFIQKKGFLDGDQNYLANHLQQLQKKPGSENTFFSFYRKFLLRLFREGLGQSEHTSQWEQEFGSVPYLNGGLFEEHQLEQRYDIQIADEAFAKIFAFFNQWQWHLDTREERDDREINPDVLGYIFERFTNQKEMGSYYTKEDITTHIASQAIIAHVCDRLAHKGYDLFGSSSVGQILLRADPARYCYTSAQKGVDIALPAEIAAGISDVTQRALWANVAPAIYALPTETWREVIARRQRFARTRERLVNGTVTSINDLTAHNLDIVAFLHDVLRKNQDAALLWQVYTILSQMTILDPTCGSGAFLLAALNVLKPLYDLCLQQMAAFVALASQQSEQAESADRARYLTLFRATLLQVAQHTNGDFFVLKSIIMNNLYGVDIKLDVVEICRLRLFLKLVAQFDTIEDLEPLPDIDFNIHPGNSLLGFATFEEVNKAVHSNVQLKMDPDHTMERVAGTLREANALYHSFQILQQHALASKHQLKAQFTAQLLQITQELHVYLAREYGVKEEEYQSGQWQQRVRPFHWFIRFYEIMQQGGFSVIIGNPPYIEYKEVKKQYTLQNYATFSAGNIYALIMERSAILLAPGGRFGMIVPSSATCTDGYIPLQRILLAQNAVQIASFSDQRGKLFAIPHPRLCIIQYQKPAQTSSQQHQIFATPYLKLEPKMRVSPFERLHYQDVTNWVRPGVIPRFGSTIEYGIARKLFAQKETLSHYTCRSGNYCVYYTRKLSWFVQVAPFSPLLLNEQGDTRYPSELKILRFAQAIHADIAFTALNSNLFYWLLTTSSDCRNLNKREVSGLPLCMKSMGDVVQNALCSLARQLEQSLQSHSEQQTLHYNQKDTSLTIQRLFPIRSRPVIDEIDLALARHYGFTAEETDFLLAYDGKYRHG